MKPVELLGLILPLGVDTFVVAAALGLAGATRRQRRRITALFTSFEAGMPLVGLLIGAPLGHASGRAAAFIAAGVLMLLGLHMLFGDGDESGELTELDALHGLRWLLLGVSISLDELAIGFTLGLLGLPVLPLLLLIALQTVAVTQLGLRLGHRLGDRLREGAERLAGVALAGLGAALLVERWLG